MRLQPRQLPFSWVHGHRCRLEGWQGWRSQQKSTALQLQRFFDRQVHELYISGYLDEYRVCWCMLMYVVEDTSRSDVPNAKWCPGARPHHLSELFFRFVAFPRLDRLPIAPRPVLPSAVLSVMKRESTDVQLSRRHSAWRCTTWSASTWAWLYMCHAWCRSLVLTHHPRKVVRRVAPCGAWRVGRGFF